MVNRADVGREAEAVVAEKLRSGGFTILDLNELVGNCPFADLLARQGDRRILVQVKGTRTAGGKFGTPPQRVRALASIAEALDCQALYAFCHFTVAGPIVRFSDPSTVARLADEDAAAYARTNRYHVVIDNFTVEIDQIHSLLSCPALPS
jgi:hypothetical protein